MPLDLRNEHRREIPDLVAICQWAIAAGRAGHFLHLVFRNYPAPVVGDLFRVCAQWAGGARPHVHGVYGLHDFRQLDKVFDQVRLVLVFEPRLLMKTAWLVAMRRQDGVGVKPCPAVMACHSGRHLEDDLGATLILHGYPGKVASVTEWLRGCKAEALGTLPEPQTGRVVIEPRIEALLWPVLANQHSGLQRYRDCQILRGLLIGSSLLRMAQAAANPASDLEVGLQDYASVYGPIRGASLRPGDEPFDPLAVAMVNRANVHLAIRQESSAEPIKAARIGSKRPADAVHAAPDGRPVTRREVFDLGNPKGKKVLRLVKHLLSQGKAGYKVFRTLGTVRTLPEAESWPEDDPVHLARLLQVWSEKQVRDHFHRLFVEGLITALPRPGNQPWLYVLPEVLSDPNSPFKSLPSPDSLAVQTVTAEDAAVGRLPAASPPIRADGSPDESTTNDPIQPS
ncbi:MAG: hypothetical protein ACYC3I_06550 [Gemmataceae bacterium]